jgi:hypothetical protein
MKPLSPKAILIGGPLGLFVAAMIPILCLTSWGEGLLYFSTVPMLIAVFVGVPIFSAVAWGSSWAFHGSVEGDPYNLDRRFRFIERNLAMSGMGAIGYLAGYGLTNLTILGNPAYASMLSILFAILAICCGLVVLCIASIKPGLAQRIEFLQKEITRLKAEQRRTTGG